LRDLELLFRHKVLRMLLVRGKINRELIRMMGGWKHSGFNDYADPYRGKQIPREIGRLSDPLLLLSAADGIPG
jgi:hypothetical protein